RSPKVKVALTPQEKELISEVAAPATQPQPAPAKMPAPQPFANFRPKRHPVRNFFLILLLLAVLAGGGYYLYINKMMPSFDLWPKYVAAPAPQPDQAAALNDVSSQFGGASSTQDSGLASGTPTSTLDSLASSTPASASSSPVLAPSPSLVITNTPTGYLNVRSSPSTAASVLTQVHPGDVLPYSTNQAGWYQVTLPSGQTGWISGQYVQLQ
ncbi:MAG TPA: SH3 domain-containing protein, partial [Patescibacteria group bacterium]|nr:SH3 domain-containing protein [Patescibacteria group bacterium]